MKLILIGGHLTPALAMLDFLQSKHPEVNLCFIGRTHSRVDQKALELTEVSRRGIKFLSLAAPKFAMVTVWIWLFRFGQLLASSLRATQILKLEKPDCVVSFGGYLAVPIVLAAWRLKIPVVTHEQTRAVGLANRVIGKFAKYVGVSFPESQIFFDQTKTSVVGNLIRSSIFDPNLTKPSWFENPANLPVLIVTGGSQGSQKINQVIDELAASLVNVWCVVHQRGPQTSQSRPAPNIPGYFSFEWLSASELFWLWRQPGAVSISRAGANTVSELAVAKIPAILIPLPNTYQNEQQLNAAWLASLGTAYVLPQAELSAKTLAALISQAEIASGRPSPKTNTEANQPLRAAEQVWNLINQAIEN